MPSFRHVALLHAHPRLPLLHDYHIADLIELCGLAACIRELVDDVSIPITPVDHDPLGSFERFVKRCTPDLVGISSFTCSASSAKEYARIAKEHGAYVVMGGFHPSALPEEVLGCPHVDVVVRGEGEATFQELVAGGGSPADIAGLSFRSSDEILHNPDRELITDLDRLPLPLRDLRPARFGLSGLDYHTDTIYASRGCKGTCSFCANHLVGKTWRPRSVEAILEELATIPPPQKGPWKVVKFWDSNFLTDPERIDRLCDGILERKLERQFRFMAETRIEDVIRAREILPKMHRAGFVRIGCGIESPHRATHRALKKGINLSLVSQATQLLTDASIMFSKFLIIGHQDETTEDILQYPEYALQHGVELQNTTFFIMTPYPGTVLAEQYRERGLIASTNWDLYTNLGAVIQPSGISSRRLQGLHCAVMIQYGVARRFLLGKPFTSLALKLVEALMVTAKTCLIADSSSHQEIATTLWQALLDISGQRRRPRVAAGKRRRLDDAVLHISCRQREPLLFGIARTADTELLVVGPESEVGAQFTHSRQIHLSLHRLIAYVDNEDFRALVHPSLTCYWNPRAFRLRWLWSYLRALARLLGALTGMGVFHLRRSWRRPTKHSHSA